MKSSPLYIWLLVCFIAILSCTTHNHLSEISHTDYRFDTDWQGEADADTEALIQPYRIEMEAEMNSVIGHASEELKKESPESNMGNFTADAILFKTEEVTGRTIDLAIQNYGGLRINSLAAGPVTLGKIYELMPFDNTLVVFEIKGRDLLPLFDHMANRGGWPVSGTVRMTIVEEKAGDIQIKGEPLEPDRIYVLAINSYLANGGDRLDFSSAIERHDYPDFIRALIISYIMDLSSRNMQIESKIEGRTKLLE